MTTGKESTFSFILLLDKDPVCVLEKLIFLVVTIRFLVVTSFKFPKTFCTIRSQLLYLVTDSSFLPSANEIEILLLPQLQIVWKTKFLNAICSGLTILICWCILPLQTFNLNNMNDFGKHGDLETFQMNYLVWQPANSVCTKNEPWLWHSNSAFTTFLYFESFWFISLYRSAVLAQVWIFSFTLNKIFSWLDSRYQPIT